MAKMLDLGTVVSVSNWENGKCFCDIRTLAKMADFFEKPAHWFLMPEDVDALKKSLRMLPPGLAAGF
jgi:transcriptional regulator with XRE-family HTH domain